MPSAQNGYSLAWTLAQRARVKWCGETGLRRAADTAILRNKPAGNCRCACFADVVV
jgi:hypothetical protein